MSTRAYIGIQNKSGKSISYTYCHFDGYIEGVGKVLINHYKTRQKVFRLIANGDLSSLGERINPRAGRTHTFNSRQPDVCCFYHRDRGDDKTGPYKAMTPNNFREHVTSSAIAYAYYIDNDNVWWVSCGGDPFVKLSSFFDTEKEESDQKDTKVKISFTIKDKKTRDEILGVLNKFNVEYSALVVE